MAVTFTINWSDDIEKQPIIISELATNNIDTSLTLYGHGFPNYGEGLQENLIRILENFSSPYEPINPTKGQLWYDSINNVLKIYDGQAFRYKYIPHNVPTNPELGDLYFDDNQLTLNIWRGNNWVPLVTSLDLDLITLDLNNHASDMSLHITPDQNVLLDAISNTITGGEINALDGISGNIQNQIDSHINDDFRHLTADQNSLLDGISANISSSEINYLDGVNANIQGQFNAINTQLSNLNTTPSVPSGSVMVFYMAAAPTGWTQQFSNHDSMLRIVSGPGGGSGGTDSPIAAHTHTGGSHIHSTSNHTLTITEMPLHNHTLDNVMVAATAFTATYGGAAGDPNATTSGSTTGNTGGGIGHNHGNTGSATVNVDAAFTPKYINVILAIKD